MKTFNQYIQKKEIDSLVETAANLMVELDINPSEFVLEYVSKDPEIESKLLEYIEIQENILGAAKELGGRAINAVKQFGQNVWSGGGIQGGVKQAMDTMSGPAAKFETAARVLDDLVKSLSQNPQTQNMTIQNDPVHSWANGKNLAGYLADIVKQLKFQKDMIPKMTPVPNTQPQMAQTSSTP